MNDYTEELGFWLRLESFIKDIQPNCCMGEEDKDMILHNCKLKILNLQHVSRSVEPVGEGLLLAFVDWFVNVDDSSEMFPTQSSVKRFLSKP